VTARHATLPVVDVSPLVFDRPGRERRGDDLVRACREVGFFCATGHGVPAAALERLESESRLFFSRPASEKAEIAMARGGRAWRGWFPVGDELTSGEADLKEGIYFGRELGPGHPRVDAGTPLHGPNLFPASQPGLRDAVLDWMAALEPVAQALLRGVALGLGLDQDVFRARWTADPLVLFRVFHYPAPTSGAERRAWGVGEHTDYGLLTLLAQDDAGGLEVRTPDGWIEAAPVPGALVVNVGDMLERLTCGRLRSTPHRVRNHSGRSRLSFPYFFDPSWDADLRPIRGLGSPPADGSAGRWDGVSVHEIGGTYGEYLASKVAKVFPDLGRDVLGVRGG
jgi:isopenicillin N synthase-like dioxygenase